MSLSAKTKTTELSESAKPPDPSKPRIWLDITDAADIAGYSVRHFRRKVENDGLIKKIGRKHFIIRQDLDRWMIQHPVNPTPKP